MMYVTLRLTIAIACQCAPQLPSVQKMRGGVRQTEAAIADVDLRAKGASHAHKVFLEANAKLNATLPANAATRDGVEPTVASAMKDGVGKPVISVQKDGTARPASCFAIRK